MVIAQPFLTLTPNEPFVCSATQKAAQLAAVGETLAIARARHHGAPATHFTVFPEYSIPGVEGVALIQAAVTAAEWPIGSVVIGGTDALSKTEFAALAEQPNTYFDSEHNSLDGIGTNQWLNCGITWVKGADGTVERWLQPKLHPAWPEQNINFQDMYRGHSVFLFKGPFANGTLYRFSSLVCFDWIATIGNQKAWRWVVQNLNQEAAQAQAEYSLSWFFVIQHNRRPSDNTFLNEVAAFFDQTAFPSVHRQGACLIFANTAGKAGPGRSDLFGSTSLIFTRQTLFSDATSLPTFSNGGERFRSSTLLAAYRDVYFRERGACVHSFAQVNPSSITAGAAGRTIALDRPFVFPLNGTADPRAPRAAVPACVKWLNDTLDEVQSLAARYPAATLAAPAEAAHRHSIQSLRGITSKSAAHTVKLATAEATAKHADEWDAREAEAVEHFTHTLTILDIGYPHPTVGADPAHATIEINGQSVDLFAIRGSSHEACIEHSKSFVPRTSRQILLISRDRDNTPWRKRLGSILQPEPAKLGEERRFVDPQGGTLHLGYERLLQIFRDSSDAGAVQEAVNAELAA